eukprot:760628-Pelagomonas_calceolata.AAC.1
MLYFATPTTPPHNKNFHPCACWHPPFLPLLLNGLYGEMLEIAEEEEGDCRLAAEDFSRTFYNFESGPLIAAITSSWAYQDVAVEAAGPGLGQ